MSDPFHLITFSGMLKACEGLPKGNNPKLNYNNLFEPWTAGSCSRPSERRRVHCVSNQLPSVANKENIASHTPSTLDEIRPIIKVGSQHLRTIPVLSQCLPHGTVSAGLPMDTWQPGRSRLLHLSLIKFSCLILSAWKTSLAEQGHVVELD